VYPFEYIGNLHIHSIYSDGGWNIPKIAQSAAAAGLDFICLNDHDFMMDHLHLEEEGFYGQVLVLAGLEIGERYHHYLSYNLKKMIKNDPLHPQEVIDQVNDQGGLGFLAHPFEKGMPFRENSVAYTWNDLSVDGYTGICIWNFMSRWKERIKTVFHGLYMLAFKSQTLKPPDRETLAFWDKMCQRKRVTAIGGSDAHGTPFRLGFLNFTPISYDYLLNTINVHILLKERMPKNIEDAKKAIYGAMREGRLYISHDRICSGRGFKFTFVSRKGLELIMGEEADFEDGELNIILPREGDIRLFKDGALIERYGGRGASYPVLERGVYRVEVYRRVPLFGLRPWIFSNPIYLR